MSNVPAYAAEALWPQLARYAVSIAGSVLVGAGVTTTDDWAIISGAVLALAPPLYRIVATWAARRKAAA